MVTISDVARLAGVSKATVSRVLNQSDHAVNADTRERVQAAVAQLGFRPNAVARSLFSKCTRSIGLIIPDITNPYYAGITRGVEDVASVAGYTVLLCDTDRRPEKETAAFITLLDKRVDGLIVAGGGSAHAGYVDEVSRAGIAVMLVGRHTMEFPSVRVDNRAGARAATEHLINEGHRRIACIVGPGQSITSDERCQGYLEALQSAGLDGDFLEQGDFRPESGYEAAGRLLAREPRPTAIFACNDLMAIGALKQAQELGLAVPRDLALVGFDDIPLSSYVQPPLTTVAVPMYDLGTAAMTNLLQILRHEEVPPVSWLELHLVVRESSRSQLH